MKKSILVVLVRNRRSTAVKIQKLLTGFGCYIKTRLGIHDGVVGQCSDVGLLILELVGDKKNKTALTKSLNKLSGVKAKMVEVSL